MTHVTAVNHNRRIALFDDNQVGEIIVWWTAGGFEHEERPPNPVSCMVQHPSGELLAVDLRDFEKIVRH